MLTLTSLAVTTVVAIGTLTLDVNGPIVPLQMTPDAVVMPVYVSPVFWQRYKSSRAGLDYAYVFTGVGEGDERGPGLAKIDKATGQVVRQVVLGDRTPDFRLDPIGNRLYFRRGSNRIDSFEF